jgi:hypothetical protein
MSYADDLRAERAPEPAPPAPRRRWDLVLAWAVLVGPLLATALWLGARQRVGDLEEALVEDAALLVGPHQRPLHVDRAGSGTFGDAAARHLPAIRAEADARTADTAARDAARAVVAGERPLEELPRDYAAAVDRLGPDLDGLLAGTHAAAADLPADVAFGPAGGETWGALQLAALFVGVRARRLLAAGEPTAAVATCLDGLALARDLGYSGSLVGLVTGAAVVSRLDPPCAEAIAAAPGPVRADAAARVRWIRGAFPTFGQVMRTEAVTMQLMAFRPILSADLRARLPREAEPHLRDGDRVASWWERLMLRDGWRSTRASYAALTRAAEAKQGRREAMRRVGLDATVRWLNPLAAIAMPDFSRYGERHDAALLRLDALLLVAAAADARARTGKWPDEVDDLAEDALTPAEAERLSGVALEEGAGGTLTLELPLPVGKDGDPERLTLRIRAR